MNLIPLLTPEDQKAAARRAVHLLLLARDSDSDGMAREFARLAYGDDADPEFVTAVLAGVLGPAGLLCRALNADTIDKLIGTLSAANAPDDLSDLDDLDDDT